MISTDYVSERPKPAKSNNSIPTTTNQHKTSEELKTPDKFTATDRSTNVNNYSSTKINSKDDEEKEFILEYKRAVFYSWWLVTQEQLYVKAMNEAVKKCIQPDSQDQDQDKKSP